MNSKAEEKGTQGYQVLGASTLALLASNLAMRTYAPLLPLIIETLGLSYTQAGLLSVAQSVTYTALQIPMGYFADRYGPKRTMTIGVLGVGLSSILFAFSKSFTEALLARGLIGAALSGVFVLGLRVVGNWFPPRTRGFAMGVFGAAGSVGIGLAGLMAPPLALGSDWRFSVILLCPPALISAIISYTLIMNSRVQVEGGSAVTTHRIGFGGLVFRKDAVLLGVNQFARWGISDTFLLWLSTYLYTSKGFSLLEAGVALTAAGLIGLPSNIAGGVLSDKMKSRVSVVVMSWLGLSLLFPALVLLKEPLLVMVLVLAVSWLGNSQRSPLFAIIPDIFEPKTVALATGVQNTWANMGAILFPLLLGIIRDNTGSFEIGWFSLSVFSALMVVLSLYLKRLIK